MPEVSRAWNVCLWCQETFDSAARFCPSCGHEAGKAQLVRRAGIRRKDNPSS